MFAAVREGRFESVSDDFRVVAGRAPEGYPEFIRSARL